MPGSSRPSAPPCLSDDRRGVSVRFPFEQKGQPKGPALKRSKQKQRRARPVGDAKMDDNPRRVPHPSCTQGEKGHVSARKRSHPVPVARQHRADQADPHPDRILSDIEADSHRAQLAKTLRQRQERGPQHSTSTHEPFPSDALRLPVPDEVIRWAAQQSGAQCRATLALLWSAYEWDDEREDFRVSARMWTAAELYAALPGHVGVTRQSFRTALQDIARAGYADRQGHRYRWNRRVPAGRYTYLPVRLLYEDSVSGSALRLLLALYQATWGEAQRLDGQVQHPQAAQLTTADLMEATDLSRPTVRRAWEELSTMGAASRGRPGPGRAYRYRVVHSFFADTARYLYPPSLYVSRVGTHNRARPRGTGENWTDGDPTQGASEGERSGLTARERRDCRRLTSDPFHLPFHVAARLSQRRSAEQIQSAIGARRQRDDVRKSGAWIRAALEQCWFAPRTGGYRAPTPPEKRTGGISELGDAVETPPQKSLGGGDSTDSGPTTSSSAGGRDVGLSHREMRRAVDALSGLTANAFRIKDGQNGSARFMPRAATVRRAKAWAIDAGDERAERWARRIITEHSRTE